MLRAIHSQFYSPNFGADRTDLASVPRSFRSEDVKPAASMLMHNLRPARDRLRRDINHNRRRQG